MTMNSTEQFQQRVTEGLQSVKEQAGFGDVPQGSVASNQRLEDNLVRVTVQDRGSEVSTNAELSDLSGQQSARLTQRTRNGVIESTEAVVATNQGEYDASEDGHTIVRREGYGQVELKNPRAKVLVAALAHKVIGRTQDAMTEQPELSVRQLPSKPDEVNLTRRRRSMSVWS